MRKGSVLLLFVLLSYFCFQLHAEDSKKVVVYLIQSYSPQVPCAKDWNNGILYKLQQQRKSIDLRVRYLHAKYWSYEEEKAILRNLTDTIISSKAALVITQGDEATASFLTSGHPRRTDIPVLVMGVQHPDYKLFEKCPHVFGYICEPDYLKLLEIATRMFPEKKEVFCINDDGYLSQQASIDFHRDWKIFNQKHSGYKLRVYDATKVYSFELITKMTYPRYVGQSIAIIPKWSPFVTVLGKNSKCPYFTAEAMALRNGAYAALAPDPYQLSLDIGDLLLKYLNRSIIPSKFGLRPYDKDIMQFDYKQLKYFHTPYELANQEGNIINISYYDKYRTEIVASLIILLIAFTVMTGITIVFRRKQHSKQIELRLQEEVQEKLQRQKEEFDNIFHSMNDCMATYTVDTKIHYINYTLRKLINGEHFSLDELDSKKYDGLPAGSFYHIIYNEKNILNDLIDKTLKTKKVVQLPKPSFVEIVDTHRAYPITGSMFPVFSNSEITGVALSFRNIADEEINKSLFDLAVKNAHIIPWRFAFSSGEFTFPMNSLEALGYGEKTSITRSELRHKIHPDDLRYGEALFTGMQGDKANVFQVRIVDIYGRYHWFEVRCTYMEGIINNQMSYNIVGVCQNIQQFKESEQVLIEAREAAEEADKMKSTFLANMSHEIRTPLNAIVGFTSILPDLLSSSSKAELDEMIHSVRTNSDLLLNLIRDVMELSSIQTDTMNYTFNDYHLSTLLSTAYKVYGPNCPVGVEFQLDIPEIDNVNITTDDKKLDHVLSNLLNNAFKFTTKGYVKLGCDVDKENNKVVIYVEDTGCGIPEEEQSHIFERFYKANEFKQGAGLGLNLCRVLVDNLGGEINVHSTVGEGSRFEVCLPG